MSLSFKTVRGEVYSNCNILFGPKPVTIHRKDLSEKVNRQGIEKSVKQWLLDDPRLAVIKGNKGLDDTPPDGDPDKKPSEGKDK